MERAVLKTCRPVENTATLLCLNWDHTGSVNFMFVTRHSPVPRRQ
jgi:hypothetical protein